MNIVTSLRNILLSGMLVLAAFVVPGTAIAAGNFIVEQDAPNGYVGNWRIWKPNGLIVADDELRRSIGQVMPGSYRIEVESSFSATTHITVYQHGKILASNIGRTLQFNAVHTDGIVAVISYAFDGGLVVESQPSGRHFFISTGKNRIQGRTPATLKNLVPGEYMVHFESQPGCETPKPIRRRVENRDTLHVSHLYNCGQIDEKNALFQPPKFIQPDPVVVADTMNIQQMINQQEVMPGGVVMSRIIVRNTSPQHMHDVVVSQQFDPRIAALAGHPAQGGVVTNGQVQWTLPELQTGGIWVVETAYRFNEYVGQGDHTVLTARIKNAGNQGDIVASSTIGMPYMPETGRSTTGLLTVLTLTLGAVLVAAVRPLRRYFHS